MKQFKQIFCGMLAASLLAGSASPMEWAQSSYQAHTTAINRAGGVAAAIAALYFANRFMNGKIDRALRRNADDLRHRWEQLDSLENRFNNTPFENFRQVADEKITALTNQLDAHTANKIALLNAEFDRVVAERKRVEMELQQSRALLRQVELFMQSVRDKNGDAFLRQIIQTKHEVEDSYLRLQRTKNHLDQELTSLASRAAMQSTEVRRVEERADQLNNSVRTLERFVQAQQDLTLKTRQAEQRAAKLVEESSRAERKLRDAGRVSNSFDQLRSETERLNRKAQDVRQRIDAVRIPQVAHACQPPSAGTQATAPAWNGESASPRYQAAPNNNASAPSAPIWQSNDDPQ